MRRLVFGLGLLQALVDCDPDRIEVGAGLLDLEMIFVIQNPMRGR